jgi:transcriptional regulator with XRE-family HTH domain
MEHLPPRFGSLLRRWRDHRRLSQEALANDAEISTRHLSCLESGKARPSREMVLVLASALDVPLRDRNAMLAAAGFAAVYRESTLGDDTLAPLTQAIDLILERQEPFGAVVLDRWWDVKRMNAGAARLFARFPPTCDEPPVVGNVVRAVLHPHALRPYVVNWEEVAKATVQRLQRDLAASPDDERGQALLREVLSYPDLPAAATEPWGYTAAPFLSVHLRRGDEEVRLFTLLTTLGTPLDVTAQELAIESYFPADAASDRYLRAIAAKAP